MCVSHSGELLKYFVTFDKCSAFVTVSVSYKCQSVTSNKAVLVLYVLQKGVNTNRIITNSTVTKIKPGKAEKSLALRPFIPLLSPHTHSVSTVQASVPWNLFQYHFLSPWYHNQQRHVTCFSTRKDWSCSLSVSRFVAAEIGIRVDLTAVFTGSLCCSKRDETEEIWEERDGGRECEEMKRGKDTVEAHCESEASSGTN